MIPLLFLVLITFLSTFPCTDFRSMLFPQYNNINNGQITWRRGVVVTTAAQLHSTKPELRFYAGSSLHVVSEIRDGEDLSNAFHRSTIPRKQFIIIITTHLLRPIGLRGVTTNSDSCASQLSGKILHLCCGVLPKQLYISQNSSLIDFN